MGQQRLSRALWLLVIPAWFACAAVDEPSAPERPVDIAASQANFYWTEVERRVPSWFRNGGVDAPALPPAETVFARVHFLEVPHEYLETCTFNSQTFEVRIGDDKWDSGCVPHELGHAALWLVGNPCWDRFEHPNETPTHCD